MKKGILVFTDEVTLEHKKRDGKKSDDRYCFWDTARFPKRFDNQREFCLYMAIKGKVRGYFMIFDVEDGETRQFALLFHSDSWKEIKDGEQLKASQGWRYYPKLKN